MAHHPVNSVLPTGRRPWRAGAAVLAAALLAACGSGGGDSATGGIPGTGGGDPRPGSGGTPLQLSPVFVVRNDHGNERTETIRASVPFPMGMVMDLTNVGISGIQNAWTPMQEWPDGSVRIAQAQFTDTLAAGEQKSYSVHQDITPLAGAFQQNDWVSQIGSGMVIGAAVKDTFGVEYRSLVDWGHQFEVLQENYLVRVQRRRTYHSPVAGPGIGRDYLTSIFYLTEFRDMPFVLVDWVLGNDYQGVDDPQGSTSPNLYPLGGIDVLDARFRFKGVSQCTPYFPDLHGIGAREPVADGFESFPVMKDTYLDDGQTRRYRFVLYFEHPNADPAVQQRWRDTRDALVQQPMYALADIATWQDTFALGLLGGPIDGPADAPSRAESEYQGWRNANHFGTWGSFGDLKVTGTTGTPRNHAFSPELQHAVQAQNHKLLFMLEQKAWAQSMRPYHLWKLKVPDSRKLLLWDCPPVTPGSRDLSQESLGRREIVNNDPYPQYRTLLAPLHASHGWQHYDHEHWTTDLLFDYWTVTGDPWAKEELRQLGENLKSLMRVDTFSTAYLQAVRAEGWTMEGFAQIYLATGDPAIKAYALRRIREVVEPQRGKWHASKALGFQQNYPGTGFGGTQHEFFMPWQHGALLYGYLGAFIFFGEPLALTICEDAVRAVDYSWVRNFNDPKWGFIANGLRYYTPTQFNNQPVPADYFDSDPNVGVKWGDSPLGGAHTFLIGGLHVIRDLTQDPVVWNMAKEYGDLILGTIGPNDRWNKWCAVLLK